MIKSKNCICEHKKHCKSRTENCFFAFLELTIFCVVISVPDRITSSKEFVNFFVITFKFYKNESLKSQDVYMYNLYRMLRNLRKTVTALLLRTPCVRSNHDGISLEISLTILCSVSKLCLLEEVALNYEVFFGIRLTR